MNHIEYVYAIFPYLTTYAPVRIRGVELHPSSDLSGIPEHIRAKTRDLADKFFLRGDYRINDVTCAVFGVDTAEQVREITERVRLVQTLLTYMYAHPVEVYPDLSFRAEQATVCMFIPKKVSRFLIEGGPGTKNVSVCENDEENITSQIEIEGYEGLFDIHTTFWITGESRIYPPYSEITLNAPQDIATDVRQYLSQRQCWPMERIFEDSSTDLSEFDTRILTSMQWYNRSTRGNVAPEEALVDLSIAFESLLGLTNATKLTDRFEESIKMLLGNIPRLDSWLRQFYSARSAIVHEGATPHLRYLSVDRDRINEAWKDTSNPQAFLPFVSYGWQIYRLSLMSILTGHALVSSTNLKQSLVHSQERIERICELLSEANVDPVHRILSIKDDVESLHAHWLVSTSMVSEDAVLAACKLAMKALAGVLESTSPDVARLLRSIADGLRERRHENDEDIRTAKQYVQSFVPSEREDSDLEGRAVALVSDLLDFSASAIPLRIRFTEDE